MEESDVRSLEDIGIQKQTGKSKAFHLKNFVLKIVQKIGVQKATIVLISLSLIRKEKNLLIWFVDDSYNLK